MNLKALLGRSRLSFSEFWAARDARERAMLAVAALVVTFGLAYALLIDPALSGRERLNKDLPELRRQVAQMQSIGQGSRFILGKIRCANDRDVQTKYRGSTRPQRLEAAKRDADR